MKLHLTLVYCAGTKTLRYCRYRYDNMIFRSLGGTFLNMIYIRSEFLALNVIIYFKLTPNS